MLDNKRYRAVHEIREQAAHAAYIRKQYEEGNPTASAYWTGVEDALSWLLRERKELVTQEMLDGEKQTRHEDEHANARQAGNQCAGESTELAQGNGVRGASVPAGTALDHLRTQAGHPVTVASSSWGGTYEGVDIERIHASNGLVGWPDTDDRER